MSTCSGISTVSITPWITSTMWSNWGWGAVEGGGWCAEWWVEECKRGGEGGVMGQMCCDEMHQRCWCWVLGMHGTHGLGQFYVWYTVVCVCLPSCKITTATHTHLVMGDEHLGVLCHVCCLYCIHLFCTSLGSKNCQDTTPCANIKHHLGVVRWVVESTM